MASVKKVKQKTIRLIEEAEAILALEILLSENELTQSLKNHFRFRLSRKTASSRQVFRRIYQHKCVETLNDILAWSGYIFTEARMYPLTEIYSKYAKRVSLIV